MTASDGRRSITLTPETVSQNRSSSPGELRDELAGNPDNIVMHTLRKKPQQRYGSVHDLSQDINCYLQGLPVAAPVYVTKSEGETVVESVTQPVASESDCMCNDPAPAVKIVIPKKAVWKTLVVSTIVVALIAAVALFFYFRQKNIYFIRIGSGDLRQNIDS